MSDPLDAREALIEATAMTDHTLASVIHGVDGMWHVLCVQCGWRASDPDQYRCAGLGVFHVNERKLDAILSARTSRPCETCGGSGFVGGRRMGDFRVSPEPCPTCHGAGTIPAWAIVDVLVERGVLEPAGHLFNDSSFTTRVGKITDETGIVPLVYRVVVPEEKP